MSFQILNIFFPIFQNTSNQILLVKSPPTFSRQFLLLTYWEMTPADKINIVCHYWIWRHHTQHFSYNSQYNIHYHNQLTIRTGI